MKKLILLIVFLLPLFTYGQHEGEVYFDDLQQIVSYLEVRNNLDSTEIKTLLIRLKTTQKYCKLVYLKSWEN